MILRFLRIGKYMYRYVFFKEILLYRQGDKTNVSKNKKMGGGGGGN